MSDPNNEDGLSSLAKAYRAAGPWLGAVWQFTGSALFGVAVGYGIDRYFGVSPWGLVIGGMVGNGVGFYAFIITTTKLTKSSQSKSSGEKKQ